MARGGIEKLEGDNGTSALIGLRPPPNRLPPPGPGKGEVSILRLFPNVYRYFTSILTTTTTTSLQ